MLIIVAAIGDPIIWLDQETRNAPMKRALGSILNRLILHKSKLRTNSAINPKRFPANHEPAWNRNT